MKDKVSRPCDIQRGKDRDVVRTPEGKDHSEFPATHGRIILKLI